MTKKAIVAHCILLTAEVGAVIGLVAYQYLCLHPIQPRWEDRMDDFDAVKVVFDAAGGQCPDSVRVVRTGGAYGANMNLYPSEDRGFFRSLSGGAELDAGTGVIRARIRNDGGAIRFANYFTTNAVAAIGAGETWTYVADVGRFRGRIARWDIGQTLRTNGNVYAQLSCANLGTNVVSGAKIFRPLKALKWPRYSLLDRAYLAAGPGQSFEIEFRVSLFAGTAVNAANYRYVKPGETLECPLPVPVRPGYAFLGWYDGDRKIEAGTRVTRRDAHALKARWREAHGTL